MSKNICQFLYLVGIAILAFSSCDLSFLNGNRSYQYSLVDGDEISNIPDDEFFNVNIKSAYYTGDSNTFDPLDFMLYALDDGPGTDCKISINEESATEDLYCILEVAEGDLWFHEINLQYNVPPGMCPYLAFLPHWHYNQESGYGNRTVYECDKFTSRDSSGEAQYEKMYSLTSPAPPNHDDKKICRGNSKKEVEDLCPYNKSTKDEDGDLKNCCIGKYTVVGGEEKDNGEWGGDIKNCIGGLARINWNTFDKDGFPAVLIKESGSKGLKEDYTLHPLYGKIDQGSRLSLPIANYFEGAEEIEEGGEPAYYKSPVNGVSLLKGEPFVTWACLDQNQEVLHTIKLLIREWNTQEEFASFKESEGSRGDSDIGGLEGSECDYYENDTLSFGNCNDLNDVDDFNSVKSNCNTDCTAVKNTCDLACTANKNTCNTNCTAFKSNCDTACDTDKSGCESACDTVKSTCDDGCEDDKDACYSGCETDCYRNPKTACAKPKVICYESCRIHKEYRDVHCYVHANPSQCRADSGTAETTCRTACDTEENTCLREMIARPERCILTCERACDSIKNTCETDCTEVEGTCDTACNTVKGECNTDCGSIKTACDSSCTDTKNTCDRGCDLSKTICGNDCTYPLIIYK